MCSLGGCPFSGCYIAGPTRDRAPPGEDWRLVAILSRSVHKAGQTKRKSCGRSKMRRGEYGTAEAQSHKLRTQWVPLSAEFHSQRGAGAWKAQEAAQEARPRGWTELNHSWPIWTDQELQRAKRGHPS